MPFDHYRKLYNLTQTHELDPPQWILMQPYYSVRHARSCFQIQKCIGTQCRRQADHQFYNQNLC